MILDMEKAIKWWDNLDPNEQINIEKEYGYYGHDIGTTVSDIIHFYKEEHKELQQSRIKSKTNTIDYLLNQSDMKKYNDDIDWLLSEIEKLESLQLPDNPQLQAFRKVRDLIDIIKITNDGKN